MSITSPDRAVPRLSPAAASSVPTTLPTSAPAPVSTAVAPEPEGAAQANALLAGMTLEEKAGQVLMIGFEEPQLTAETRALIQEIRPGGIVYFARNAVSPAQLAALSAQLQSVARAAQMPPLLIAIDQEGGLVSRLHESAGFTEFPSPMAVAATGDPQNARRLGQAMAEELLGLGINMDLAPDLDVNNNPANPIIGPRSFGSDPARVAEFGLALMRGLQDAGVAAVGKHFPGHGDTAVDSHLGLPLVPYDRSRLETVEFVPFKAAMAGGIAAIMSAHITFPAVDPTAGLPATLSPRVMTGLLRGEMRYDGLLMTDSLEMGALPAAGFPPPDAAAAALAAGADVLLMSHPHGAANTGPNVQRQGYQRVLAAVRSGKIPQSRLDEAVRRMLLAKARFGILDAPAADTANVGSAVGTAGHRELSRDIAAQAVTLLRDEARLVPLPRDTAIVVVETPPATGLGRLLAAETIRVGLKPTAAQISRAVSEARNGKLIVVATGDVAKNPAQATLVQALLDANARVVVAAVASPYDLMQVPQAPSYLATYGSAPPLLEALARVLRGDLPPAGRLPVELPGLYVLGAGM